MTRCLLEIGAKKNLSRRAIKTQIDKFKEAARELGCSEDEEAFDKAIKKLAEAPPPKTEKAKAKKAAK